MTRVTPLAGRVVNLNEISFVIHGIVHGNPLISISNKFKQSVNDSLKGLNVICEDGFVDWIQNSTSFNETTYFGFNNTSFSQSFFALKSYFYNLFIKKYHKTDLGKKVKKLQDIRDLEPIRRELFKNYLPEPEGMNSLLAKYGVGTIDNLKSEPPLRFKRYVYESKESLKYALNNDLGEVHIVVGCAHELPLEYLLKNQDLLKKINV